jgi:citrate synthase
MRQGFALGGIFFDPSNGEPSPTLTIFPRQLDRRSVRMSQLPRAFAEDLSRWAATAGIPPITTRYFIGASGEKTVLAHDEDFCARKNGEAVSAVKGLCREMNAQAALLDITATRFMERAHNASNATIKMIASTGRVE